MEKKEKKNYLWLIPLILGIAIGLFGISRIIKASNMSVPDMGAFDWFEKSTSQSSLKFSGIALTFFGFIFIGLFGTIVAYTIPRSMKASKRMFNSTMDTTRNFINSIINPEPPKVPKRYCDYCGAEIPEGSNECEGCGSRSIREEK